MATILEPDADLTGDPPAAASAQGLADRGELALVAVERTRMPMVVCDPRQEDCPIVLANKAFLDLTLYSADEVIGHNCRFLQGPGTDRDGVAQLNAAVAGGRELNIELLNYRKDGSEFWNQIWLSPVRDQHGELVYFFGSQLDVTRRKRAEELEAAERSLLMEIDHRANNVLALVDGIVRLSATDSIERYANAVKGRVRALASAQGLLAEFQWRYAPLDKLLGRQIEPYGAQRVTMLGDDFRIDPQMTQPLSLAVHELASNAARHGALSARDGRLDIHWQKGTENELCLSWKEAGGPKPSASGHRGFGSAILDGVLGRQLGATMERNWLSDGLQLHLKIPNAAATEA